MAKAVLNRTALFEVHLSSGAKMVEFAGWEMPLQYKGVKEEHLLVRSQAGVFDLSHMGEIWVRGDEFRSYVQGLITNDLERLEPYRAMYTCMCQDNGTVLDDMLVYLFPEEVMLVVNASNREKVYEWMLSLLPVKGVEVCDRSFETSLIAIQGPKSQAVLNPITDLDLETIRYYSFRPGRVAGVDALISRTGYTGEDGFEIYVGWEHAKTVWEALLGNQQDVAVAPVGLGARDTLRLEAGYALYGNELNEEITPYEAGLGWVVKLNAGDFVGRDALVRKKEQGIDKTIVGLTMEGRAIPRKGYSVLAEGLEVGKVTSGTFSPSLGKGIALALVEKQASSIGMRLSVKIRDKLAPAVVVRLPFVRGSVRKG